MTTIILNHQPYDGSDVAWNALRLAKTLHKSGEKVNIFLMNDAVDLARDMTTKPESYDHDLVDMLKSFMKRVFRYKYAEPVMHDADFSKNQPYFDESISSTMQVLADWVIASDKVLTF